MTTEDFYEVEQQIDINKKKESDKLYYELNNQMKVMLINDRSFSKISVALDIHIGNFQHIIQEDLSLIRIIKEKFVTYKVSTSSNDKDTSIKSRNSEVCYTIKTILIFISGRICVASKM